MPELEGCRTEALQAQRQAPAHKAPALKGVILHSPSGRSNSQPLGGKSAEANDQEQPQDSQVNSAAQRTEMPISLPPQERQHQADKKEDPEDLQGKGDPQVEIPGKKQVLLPQQPAAVVLSCNDTGADEEHHETPEDQRMGKAGCA